MTATSMSSQPAQSQLFSFLKRIHALPTLHRSLDRLTFPELLLSHQHESREVTTVDPLFEELHRLIKTVRRHGKQNPLFNEIERVYSSYIEKASIAQGEEQRRLLNGPTRLFALIQGKGATLFTMNSRANFVLIAQELASATGQSSTFSTASRATLEKIFQPPLFERVAALLTDTLLGEISIEEIAPIQAIEWWVLPQESLDQLLLHFSELIQSDRMVHLLAQQGNPDLIRFVVSKGANPNQVGQRRRTPLHDAAEAGQIETARSLIELGAEVNRPDLDRRTPLHLAALQGNLPMVQLLLDLRGDPDQVGLEGETLLHIAAGKGDLSLLAFLLELPSAKEWLHLEDSDGKIPLHRAVWGDPKPEAVRLLLQAGTVVNRQNEYGFTPLHWAAKHGHLQSAQLLLSAGARIDLCNQSEKSPFDLAIDWGQGEIVWLFLGGGDRSMPQIPSSSSLPPPPSSSSTSPPLSEQASSSSDPEGAIYRAFEAAYESGDPLQQIFWLEKLAQFPLQKGDFATAAHLLNGALALAEESRINPAYQRFLISRLERIEGALLERLGKKTPAEHRNYLEGHREALRLVRTRVFDLFERVAIEEFQRELTVGYQAILNRLIDECISLLGPADPAEFTVIGFGSMARGEMSPYSDLEFAFLIRNPERRPYFRALSELLELKIINMGETKSEIVRFKRRAEGDRPATSLVPSGFSLDGGGIRPSGKRGVYELIGTAQELARFQTEEWLQLHDAEIVLSNAMRTACWVRGDRTLFDLYQREINRILESKSGPLSFLSIGTKSRESRALELMRGYSHEFIPRLDGARLDLQAFDVKKELYRLPQSVISALALFYGLRKNNTLEQIDELLERRMLSEDGATRLKRVLRSVCGLRIQTHLFYKTEKEILSQGQERDLFPITPRLAQEILELYRTLIPLHQRLNLFLGGDRRAFVGSSLYDSGVGIYDDRLRAGLQSAQTAVILNPNSYFCRLDLGSLLLKLGQAVEAIVHFEEALRLLKREHGDRPYSETIKALMNLGLVYKELREFEKGIEYLNTSLVMARELHEGRPHSEIAKILTELGLIYKEHGEADKAIEYLESSLTMTQQFHSDRAHPETARSLNQLGLVYRELRNSGKAVECHQSSLAMLKQIYGDVPNQEVATTSINLGISLGQAYEDAGDYQKAIKQLDSCLIECQKNSSDHFKFDILSIQIKIKTNYAKLVEKEEIEGCCQAIEYFEQSLTMCRQLYRHTPHLETANVLINLGIAQRTIGQYQKAIEHIASALTIYKQIYHGQPHSQIAFALNELGITHKTYSEFREATIELWFGPFPGSHDFRFGDTHDVASSSLKEAKESMRKAIESFESALAIYRTAQAHDNQFYQLTGTTLHLLGLAYKKSDNFVKAIESLNSSLEIKKQFYNQQLDLTIAETLTELGLAYAERQYLFRKDFPSSLRSVMYDDTLLGPEISSEQIDLAIYYFESSIKMTLELYGDHPHPNIARALSGLGIAHVPFTIDYINKLGITRFLNQFKTEVLSSTNSQRHTTELLTTDDPRSDTLELKYQRRGAPTDSYFYFFDLSMHMYKDLNEDRVHLDFLTPLHASLKHNLGYDEDRITLFRFYAESLRFGRILNFESSYFSYNQLSSPIQKKMSPQAEASGTSSTSHSSHQYPPDTDNASLNLCFSYLSSFNFQPEKALSIVKKIYKNQPHQLIARVLAEIGIQHAKNGNITKAIDYWNSSFSIYNQTDTDSYNPIKRLIRNIENLIGEDHPYTKEANKSLRSSPPLVGDTKPGYYSHSMHLASGY